MGVTPLLAAPDRHTVGSDSLIPKHGGYRKLKSFQVARLCYDVTIRFCARYVDRRSRTHDQMVQAARSGVQNIAEGSSVSATSKKMELKLTQVARASLEELRLDYEDFLRHRRLSQWPTDDPRRTDLVARRCATADEVATWIAEQCGHEGHDGRPPSEPSESHWGGECRGDHAENSANAALVLIGVACALLDRQVASLAASFAQDGGFTERLYRARSNRRHNPPSS
jgi:four helix bundle suffix protein